MKLAPRPYRMRARAAAAAETGRGILEAMQTLFAERPYDLITVQAVADRAGVTVQTVLRRFGSKAGLLAAAAADARSRIAAQRDEAPAGAPERAVRNLFDHYERWGTVSLRLLEEEHRTPQIAALTREARGLHARWVDRVFAASLAEVTGAARTLRRAQLLAIADVYVWKVLRRDLGLSRADAERAVAGMVDAVCRR